MSAPLSLIAVPAKLTIVAPDLLRLLVTAGQAEPDAAAIAAVFARGRQAAQPDVAGDPLEHFWRSALPLLGLRRVGAGSVPPASIMAAADLGPDAAPDLLRADPVYLRPDVSRLVLFDAPSIDLGAAEADALIRILNAMLASEGMLLQRGADPTRWYLAGTQLRHGDIRGIPSARDLRGQSLEPDPIATRGLGKTRRILTEVQMLLHDCDVNTERAERGQPPVNSLWIWCGADIAPDPVAQATSVFSDDAELRSCAATGGIDPVADLPALASALAAPAGSLALLSPPGAPGLSLAAWRAQVVVPAWQALRQGRLDSIAVATPTGTLQLTAGSRWAFWRRGTMWLQQHTAT